MNEPADLGSVKIQRFLDKEREAIFALGHFGVFLEAYDRHAALWKHDRSPLTVLMMHQALAGGVLYLSCRPQDEVTAFTVNIAQPPTNIFVTGSAADLTMTGRPWTTGVDDAGMNRLYVQTQRARGKDSTSVIDVEGVDILVILEQYCRRSDQAPARFFDCEDGRFLMVASLPAEDRGWLEDLDTASVLAGLDGLPLLDEKIFWFQCGCDPARLAQVLRQMYHGRIEELFGDDDTLEAGCPRCGRQWTLKKSLLDEGMDNS